MNTQNKLMKSKSRIRVSILSMMMIFSSVVLTAQETHHTNNSEGIQFFDGSWEEALAEAKKQNKPIFLDVYATWCGPCKALSSRTFPDATAGEYFNENFINVRLDGEKGDGIKVKQELRVHSYPSLFILNSSGAPSVYSAGFVDAENLIKFGKEGVKSIKLSI